MASHRILRALALAAGLLAVPAFGGAIDEDCPHDAFLQLAGCVDLDTVVTADIQLSHAVIDASGDREASAYLILVNRGETSDRLRSATSMAAAETSIVYGDGRSVPVLAPGRTLRFEPGSNRLRLAGLARPLMAGEEVEITLRFEKAGAVVLPFRVLDPTARPPAD